MFRTRVVDKIETRVLCLVTFFFNRAVYEYCGNILYSRTGHRRQYAACAFHAGQLRLQTHSEYAILIAFPLQQWLQERTYIKVYTYIVRLV
jgi:hypothetical protein